ncbi:MAG: protein phosphatase 2C domain-containing protein, partial [Rhodobacteraceae bacterium]|nr:protein phosphatase 2C domain-containing protein [Paracoccaceae bacterium]
MLRFTGKQSVEGRQSVGQRDNQEDDYRIVRIGLKDEQDPRSDVLMIVADGMGGHAGGEVAARLACDAFERHFISVATATKPWSRLPESLDAANAAIRDRIRADPALKGMGCTLIGALKMGDRLSWVSVGDSILFLMRRGKLSRLNADHSLYGQFRDLVRAGKMEQSEADGRPKRNALRSAVMGGKIALVDRKDAKLESGDIVMLATDGLESLSDDEITGVLARESGADIRVLAEDVLNAVEAKG